MKISGKAIIAIVIVALLGAGAIFFQRRSSSPKEIKLTAHDMEVIMDELVPPPQQAQLAANPEEKQEFVKFLRRMLALGLAAERENYHQRPDIKAQLDLQTDIALMQVYRKKSPEATVGDDESMAYFQAHPNEWNEFVEANPQIKQGGRVEEIKKQYGQVKIFAERARKEGLDKLDAARLRILIVRSQTLEQAYRRELQKKSDTLVTEQEIEQYYNEHKDEFDEVHARHILISTNPPEEGGKTEDKDKDKKPAEKKALTKDEARKKAQAILERVRKGEDFAKLAKENSDDTESKIKGGDLGFFPKGDMVKSFEDTAFSLNPGQVSDLVESQFGFHIIKVEERRSASLEEQTKTKIRQKLEQQAVERELDRKVSESRVEVPEDFNINPTPVSAPPALGHPPSGAPQQ